MSAGSGTLDDPVTLAALALLCACVLVAVVCVLAIVRRNIFGSRPVPPNRPNPEPMGWPPRSR